MNKYLFEEELIPALIRSRPNRFIMLVEIDGKIEKCHCPSTGRIGNIEFKNIPCLLSRSKDTTRKTKYTVEAIIPEKNIIVGINQVKANAYVDFFLQNNLLGDMINVREIKREVKLNTSKIDFLVNENCFLEVKTLLMFIPFGDKKADTKFNSFERLGRHFQEISLQIEKGQKAIVLLCCLYNAVPFKVPNKPNAEILRIVRDATSRGLENWQINLKVDKKGVSLIDYFKLNLF
jgi:sugar fermentation stimulation protein A